MAILRRSLGVIVLLVGLVFILVGAMAMGTAGPKDALVLIGLVLSVLGIWLAVARRLRRGLAVPAPVRRVSHSFDGTSQSEWMRGKHQLSTFDLLLDHSRAAASFPIAVKLLTNQQL